METEKNQSTDGINVHDIVVISKHRRTGEDGQKLGHSYYEKDEMGVVIMASKDKLVLKTAGGDNLEYDVDHQDKDYYLTLGKGSEVEYENQIKKEIQSKIKYRNEKDQEIKDLTDWLYDFKHSISLFGRIANFIKNSSK